MEDLILAVDIGTTNVKAGVLDFNGNILRIASKEVPLERDDTGKAEHNPDTLFETFIKICREVSEGFEDRIILLVPSTYMFALLPVDKDLKPLTGIITLLDTRSQETFEELSKVVDFEEIYNRTGCPPLFHYPFAKIYWLKKRHREIFEKARYFLCSKSFIISKLIGEVISEPSVSAATQMMNINKLDWDDYALSFLEINYSNLPKLVSSETILGKVSKEVLKMMNLKRDVELLTGVYDGGAVGLGIGAMGGSVGVINLGTTGMLRVTYDKPVVDKDKSMRFQAYYLCNNKWYIGGAVNNAGIILRWFRDNIFNLSYEEQTLLADQDNSKNLFFLPFITGERYPEIGNIASGVFFGLKSFHTKNHMIRAGMEGVTYSLKLSYDALLENGIDIFELRAGGGGSKSSLWMNIFANVFNKPIKVIDSEESALLGSAILGTYSLGVYKNLKSATDKLVKIKEVYMPSEDLAQYYSKRYEFFKYLVRYMKEAFERHNKL
ncbi:MAG: carbohydrate kinase [Dictyoglomus sp. NZ13-RE01]|nr:MAG: carbohydrate kinase [Dictyoglomus sp. NZ13-RE01]